jgi:hypothetical protein
MDHNVENFANKTPKKPLLEEDIDFHFKPITDGLGFHQEKSKSKSVRSKSMRVKPAQRSREVSKKMEVSPTFGAQNSAGVEDLTIPGIEEFYRAKNQVSNTIPDQQVAPIEYEQASDMERFVAWVVDTLVIFASAILTAVLASSSTMLWNTEGSFPILDTLSNSEVLNLVSMLSVGYYVFYFSVLERSFSTTIGKKLMGLEVRGLVKSLDLRDHLMRSLITLGSIILLGLPCILKLQDKLTKSQVIRV